MGLSAPKNRSKISADPQNTTWANNTSRFGHRILTQHGWTPGSALGATDAAHAAHYTAASSSHIRVLLKDDNLGLGAKRGSERAENFGLAGLASILGRLNGNEQDVKKEEERQEKVAQRAYVYKRFGMMNFVSGGFLVGGEIKRKGEIEEEGTSGQPEVSDKKEKKRKRTRDDEDAKEDANEEQPKLKRKKKSIHLHEEAAKDDSSSKTKSSKKDKTDNKSKKSSFSSPSAADSNATTTGPLSDKARRKAEKREKRARKEEKKLKKVLKNAAKAAAQSNPTTTDPSSESEEEQETSTTTTFGSVPTTGTSTPSMAGLSFSAGGRHAVRQRYIRQKRMAAMDPQALKEIFMIKTPTVS